MKCPAEIYSASSRPYSGLPDLTYPLHDRDALVTACGRICMHRKRVKTPPGSVSSPASSTSKRLEILKQIVPSGRRFAVLHDPAQRAPAAAAPGEVRLEWQSLFDAFLRRPGWDLSRLLPRWVVEHKTSGERRCRDETAFVPAKQAIPVARDPVIRPVADTPRQQQEYSRPGPAG
jgi:hypothetical protein